ncbi:patatin-like phospholipase family protein [Patescibacteria group bacterium]
MEKKPRKTVGLALGSGGGRGIAHVGVIKALVRNNIPIDYIAGTSIGAWAGTFYGIHQDIAALEKTTLGYKKDKFLAMFEPSRKGVIKGKKMERLLHQWLGDVRFEDLKIPVTVVTTDLVTGLEVDISTGPVVPAVRASMSIPVVVEPLKYDGKVLVDGGLINPLPDDVVRKMGADIVIAVNLDKYVTAEELTDENISLSAIALRSSHIIRHYLAEYSHNDTDILIEPEIKGVGMQLWKKFFTDSNIVSLVDIGEKATEQYIPQIKGMFNIDK